MASVFDDFKTMVRNNGQTMQSMVTIALASFLWRRKEFMRQYHDVLENDPAQGPVYDLDYLGRPTITIIAGKTYTGPRRILESPEHRRQRYLAKKLERGEVVRG
ncbi:MAG: hypothetical protein ACLQU2_23160, partial [Candidatus Binataceae bacterium]